MRFFLLTVLICIFAIFLPPSNAETGVIERALQLAGSNITALVYFDMSFALKGLSVGGLVQQVIEEHHEKFASQVGFNPSQDITSGVMMFGSQGVPSFIFNLTFDRQQLLEQIEKDLSSRSTIKGKTVVAGTTVYQLGARLKHPFSFCLLEKDYLLAAPPEQIEAYLQPQKGSPATLPWVLQEAADNQIPLFGFISFKKGLPFLKNVPPMAMQMLSGLDRLFFLSTDKNLTLYLETADFNQAQALTGMLNQMKIGLAMQLESSLSQFKKDEQSMSPFQLISTETTIKVAGLRFGVLALENLKIQTHEERPFLIIKLHYKGLREALPTFLQSPSTLLATGFIASIAFPNFTKTRFTARVKACHANIRILEGALEMYDIDRADTNPLPDDKISASSQLGKILIQEGYLMNPPECPDGGHYTHEGKGSVSCTVHGKLSDGELPSMQPQFGH